MDTTYASNMEASSDASSDEVRWFRDAAHRIWHSYVVIEGAKYGVARDKVRNNWLCLESEGERRFIAPVPAVWRSWTESEFRMQLLRARPDLRS